jgi:protein TonB
MTARGDDGTAGFARARGRVVPEAGAGRRLDARRAARPGAPAAAKPLRPPPPPPRFGFGPSLAVSLLLHASLAGLGWVLTLPAPNDDDSSETLVVELDGLLAETQQEEKRAETPPPLQAEPPPAPEQAPPEPPPPPPPPEPEATEEDIVEAVPAPAPPPLPDVSPPPPVVTPPPLPPDVPPPPPVVPPPPDVSPPPPVVTPPAPAIEALPEAGQKAQAIAPKPTEEELLNRYGARLVKQVQGQLAYPDAERAARAQGTVKVAFAIRADGTIVPGSLRVVAGSGRPALDAAALATIRATAPYPPPPKPMAISFSLYFGKT